MTRWWAPPTPTGARCPSPISTVGTAVPMVAANGGVAVSLASKVVINVVAEVSGTGGVAVSCPANT